MNLEVKLDELWPTIKEVIDSGGEFRLFPKGISMMPMLRQEKDSVMLVTPVNIKRYDVVLFKRDNGHFVLHRVYKKQENTYTFCGDNQFKPEKGIREDQLLAKVNGFFKGDRYISVTDKEYTDYVKRHTKKVNRKIRKFAVKSRLSKVKRKIFKRTY